MSLVVLAIALAASAPEVVARVGSQAIDTNRLSARVVATRAAGGNTTPADLLEDLIREALLAQEGLAVGADKAGPVVARVEAERRKLAGGLYLAQELAKVAEPSEEQLRAAFRAGADLARVEWIVLASREEAQACLERLSKGAAFAAEAQRSLDPGSASQGGQLGFVSRMQLDAALQELAFGAPLERPQGPVERKNGWFVYRVLERRAGSDTDFQAQRVGLAQFLEQQTRTQMRAHVLQQLRARFGVKLDLAFLESMGTRVEPKGTEADHVVAQVAERAVKYGEVVADVRSLMGAREGHITGAALKAEYAWRRVDQLLLEDAAAEKGLGQAPAVLAALPAVQAEAVVRLQVDRVRSAAPRADDAEVEEHYRAHVADYTSPPYRTCSHILVGTRSAAEGLLASLAKGQQKFEEVARVKSRDLASAESGGLLGDLTLARIDALAKEGAEPGLAQVLRSAPAGVATGPVQSRGGWHVVRCGALVSPAPAPLATVRDALRQELTLQRGNAALIRHWDELRARTPVQIDAAALARFSARGQGGGK